MYRRTWLKSVTGAIAGHVVLRNGWAQSPHGLRTFQLLVKGEGNHPATQLLDALVSGDNIYYLATESEEATNDPSLRSAAAVLAAR